MKTQKIRTYAGTAILLFTTAFCLYYMEDGYFNTIAAKTRAFIISLAVAAGLWLIAEITSRRTDGHWLSHTTDIADRMICLFPVSYLISSLLSGDFADAITGKAGWNVGLLSYIGGTILYLFIRDLKPDVTVCARIIAAVSVPFFVFAVLHGCGVDIFGLHADLIISERYSYISTAGNINVFSGAASLIVPVMAAGYITAMRNRERAYMSFLYAGIIFLACMGTGLAGSDSGYLGIAAGLVAVSIIMCYRKYPLLYLNRMIMCASAGIVAAEIVQISVPRSFPVTEYISSYMRKYEIALTILAVTAIIGIFLRIVNSRFILNWKIAVIITGMITAAAIAIVVRKIGASPDFGSGRLLIWKKALSVFVNEDPLHQLFGIGTDMFGLYSDGLTVGDRVVVNCHCSLIQHLVCGGILTALFYVLTIISVIRKAVRDKRTTPFFFGLVGYLVQSQLNNPHNMLMPFVYIFLALI